MTRELAGSRISISARRSTSCGRGGRMFYVGAGAAGRLAAVDAAEWGSK